MMVLVLGLGLILVALLSIASHYDTNRLCDALPAKAYDTTIHGAIETRE